MANKYIFSDLHMGHRGLDRFRKWVMSSEEQNELVFENLCMLNKKDICFILGDCCFTEEWLERFKEVRCRLQLVPGNHCVNISNPLYLEVFESVMGLTTHKGHWLSHAPVHPMELRGRKNCHGHTHYQLMLDENGWPDPRYINVCLEYTGAAPIRWDYAISEHYYEDCVGKWLDYRKEGFCK